MVATGGNKEEDAIQCEVLLHLFGDEGREVYVTLTDITPATNLPELEEI